MNHIKRQIADYEERLKKNPNDPRLHYNRGTVAFEDSDYETASKELSLALGAPDLQLQQRAYYNLGNTQYRAGEQAPDPKGKIEHWEKAVENYQGAAALDPKDADAKFNLEFVKKRLDELKKEQKQDSQGKVEPSEEAKKAKAQADEAVRRKEYPKALEIMEDQLKRDSTTSYYSDYIQRLKEINGLKDSDIH